MGRGRGVESRARVVRVAVSLTVVVTMVAPGVGRAETPPGGEVSTAPITARQLIRGETPDGLTVNDRFAPSPNARRAHQRFVGRLALAGAPMEVLSDGPGGTVSNPVLGKDTTYFPDVTISFFTVGRDLVPTTQDVILNGVLPDTRSYWDVIVQPGRVWSEPGDDGWNRASFPFALVNSIEGETHTGIALFMYKGRRVSPVRFQIVQMTSPYYVPEYFTAWGTTDADYRPGGIRHLGQRMKEYRAERAARLPVRPWSELESVVDRATLDAFVEYPDFVQGAVVHDGVLYRTDCPTAAGPFPYCDQVRYGVWSVTKSSMMNVALMRLARKYGPGVVDEPIGNYLPAAAAGGWETVTYRDLANMASGHGPAEADGGWTCYLCDYDRWYVALSEADKTAEALDYPGPFVEPGTVLNYRDQDAYLLGVALDALVKAKEGPRASIADVVRDEVYRKIGIFHAPTNATVEPDGSPGQPLMAYGHYPTLDDLAKISLLYQNGGRWRGRQILDASLVRQLLPRPTAPAGSLPESESVAYYLNWWMHRLDSTEGCSTWVPQMSGWGGNTVTLLPDHTVVMRMRNLWNDSPDPQATIDALADALTTNCS